MAVPDCVRAFILAVLCGNPILRGAWVTVLNSIILQLSAEIDLITLQIERLNIINQVGSLAINSLEALKDKVTADLNLFLGPLQQFHGCVDLQQISEFIQLNAVGKGFSTLQKKLYELNRFRNLVRVQDTIKQTKQDQLTRIQNFIDEITSLCG